MSYLKMPVDRDHNTGKPVIALSSDYWNAPCLIPVNANLVHTDNLLTCCIKVSILDEVEKLYIVQVDSTISPSLGQNGTIPFSVLKDNGLEVVEE